MSDTDEGMRWWAVVGLHLLDDDAALAVDVLDRALWDESHEVRMLATWSLVKLDRANKGMACLDQLLFRAVRFGVNSIADCLTHPLKTGLRQCP